MNIMCRYCEGELETYCDPDFEGIRAYLSSYDTGYWGLTVSDGDTSVLEISVENCPWCGRELD